jgi:uncharacterized membrane protein YhdT
MQRDNDKRLVAMKESGLLWICLLGVCFSAFAAYGSLGRTGGWTGFTIWFLVAAIFAIVAFFLGKRRKR